MVEQFKKLEQDKMLGDVQRNISNIIMPKKMEDDYAAMAQAEDQEEREAIEDDEEPFDFEKRKKEIDTILDKSGANLRPPVVAASSSINARQQYFKQALKTAAAKRNEKFLEQAKDEQPLRNLGRELVRGSSKAVLQDTPELAALGVKYGSRFGYYSYTTLGDIWSEYVQDPSISGIEQANDSVISLDSLKSEHDEPFNYERVDTATNPLVKAIMKWRDTTGKEINDIVNKTVGYVPDAHKNFFTDILYKTGELAAPVIPLLSGAFMILRYPKLYNSIKDTSASMVANHRKALTQTGKDSLVRGVGVFNSALGGAVAWQSAEYAFKDTKLEGFAPFAAIVGALYGANGLARLPFTLSFGVTFVAMGKFAGVSLNEGMSMPMLRGVAISQGLPFTEIFKSDRQQLLNKLSLTSKHLKYIDDIANGLRSLPKQYKEPLQKSFEYTHKLMEKYKGKDGEQLAFFLSQVTGLGIQQSLIKATSTPLGLKFRPSQVGQITDLEVQQGVINQQIKIVQESMQKILNQKNLAEPANEEFLEIMTVLKKQMDNFGEQGQDSILKLRDLANEASVLSNVEKKRRITEVAEKLFKVERVDVDEVTPIQIEQKRVAFNDRAETIIDKAFSTAKTKNDELYDVVKKEDRLIDAEELVLMAKDEKMLANLSPLTAKGTKAGRFIKSQADLIYHARKNTLEILTDEQVNQIYASLQRSHVQKEVSFMTANGADFDFKAVSKDLNETLNPDAKSAKLREYLADITTDDLNAFDDLNKLIPPRFKLTDLLDYRSELYNRYRAKKGSAEGHAVSDLIDSVDNTLDRHFGTVEDGTTVKKMYKEAKQFYKERILPFKTQLGTKMHDTVYKLDNFGDEYSAGDLFAMFTRFKDPEQMGKVFRGMFDDGVKTPIGKFGEGENIKEAAEVFQITIGKILNGDIRGYKSGFINQMTLEQIAAMNKYKMITNDQFKGLKDIIKIRDEVKDAMDDVQQQAQRKTFEQEVMPSLTKKITEQFGEGSPLAKEIEGIKNAEGLVDKIIEAGNVDYPSLKTKGAAKALLGRADETLKGIDPDLAYRFQNITDSIPQDLKTNPLLDQVLKVIDEVHVDERKKLEALENLEKMLVYRVYKNSFSLTDQKDIGRMAGDYSKQVEEAGKFVSTQDSGLLNHVDLIAMGKTMEDALPGISKIGRAIDETRQSLGISSKAEKRETAQNLKELFEIARLSLAKTAGVDTGLLGMSLAVSSIISRAYAVVRGVVSLRFVATELFLRVHGQNKMKYITEVLTNPETVKTMHDVLVKGKTVKKEQIKYWRYVLGFMLTKEQLKQIRDEDIEKSVNVYMGADITEEPLPHEKPNPKVFRSNRVQFDPKSLSFLPPKKTMEKIKKAGQANRPTKYQVDIGKAGMPGFNIIK
tara:strand:- start:600 stop:4772 length:4173 start_codon:yes stop_codon:yes gene_type:complete